MRFATDMTGRGQCPACGGDYSLRLDGTMRRHQSDIVPGEVLNDVTWCAGSGQAPKPHVHRCVCGATWDEDVTDTADSADQRDPAPVSNGPVLASRGGR